MKHNFLYSLLLLLMCLNITIAQKSYVTASGQSIEVYPDGDWEYKDINQISGKDDLFAKNSDEVNPYEIPADKEYILSEQEERMYKKTLAQLQYLEIDNFVNHLLIQQSNLKRDEIEKEDKELEKDLHEKYEEAAKLIKKLRTVYSKKKENRKDIFSDVKKDMQDKFNITLEEEKPKLKSFEYLSTTTSAVNGNSFAVDDRNPYLIRKSNNCKIIYDAYDNQMDKHRKETQELYFFGYTHPKLMSHFKNDDFLEAHSSLMKIDKDYFINLKLTLATTDAKRSYGLIEESAMIRITLINGRKIFGTNILRAVGKIEPYTGNTIYQAIYKINKDDINILKSTEVDKVGMMWSSGFEEYDVYEVDFVKNQLKCLDHDK